ELRKGFCRQERADLEMPYARGVFLADPLLLGGSRRKLLHQLQTVAQTYFAQDDTVAGIDVLIAGHENLTRRLSISCSARPEPTLYRRPGPAPSTLRQCYHRSIRLEAPARGTACHRR